MKEVTLNRMILTNFKGIKSLVTFYDPAVARIYGENATGKTTLFDAFTWCLFGKDSTGKSDSNFAIKTLDKDNKVIPKIDHVVEMGLTVNGEPMTLKRTYRENWVKKRGREETEFAGHKTTYEWNEVPLKKAEYEAKIRNIVDESVFKLITDPHVFYNLHWEEQRKLLIEICGDVNDQDVAQNENRFSTILDQLTKKTLKEYQDQMASKRRTINDELKMIPTRIDEVSRGLPNPEPNFDDLRIQKSHITIQIEGLEKSIQKASAYDETEEARIEQIKKEILQLEAEYDDIKHIIKVRIEAKSSKLEDQYYEYKKKAVNAQTTAYETKSSIEKIDAEISNSKSYTKTANRNLADLRKEFNKVSKLKFIISKTDLICPTCKQDLPKQENEETKDRLEKRFNAEKAKKLEELNKRGTELKKDTELQTENLVQKSKLLEDLKGLLASQEKERERLLIEAKTYKDIYEGFNVRLEVEKLVHKDKGVEKIDAQVAVLKEKLANRPEADISEYTYQLSIKKQELSEIVDELALEEVLDSRKQRIQELKDSEKIKAQEMASIEREQFLLDDFVSKKTTMLQDKVNAKFNLVNFKMFEIQINGGLLPTCKAIFKGVDIADVNNAGQIQAGIDIIKTLCDHYGVYAPIFIDNAESITNIPETKSQQIHLIVSEEHAELTIL